MASTRELRELSSNESIVETDSSQLQLRDQMWRHTVIGVTASLELKLEDMGARIVGQDFHSRMGLHFSLPIPPSPEQSESPEWKNGLRSETIAGGFSQS